MDEDDEIWRKFIDYSRFSSYEKKIIDLDNPSLLMEFQLAFLYV